jgi:hypothetical protein
MPGPASATYRKIIAARQSVSAAKPVKKHGKSSTAFSSLKARQQVVERVKRTIWASVLEINEAIINLALCGNYSAAKALFDFAWGVQPARSGRRQRAGGGGDGATASLERNRGQQSG